MKTLSPKDIQIAVKILAAYRDHLHITTTHQVIELSDTPLDQHFAGKLGSHAIKNIGRIDAFIADLTNWRQSLLQNHGGSLRVSFWKARLASWHLENAGEA